MHKGSLSWFLGTTSVNPTLFRPTTTLMIPPPPSPLSPLPCGNDHSLYKWTMNPLKLGIPWTIKRLPWRLFCRSTHLSSFAGLRPAWRGRSQSEWPIRAATPTCQSAGCLLYSPHTWKPHEQVVPCVHINQNTQEVKNDKTMCKFLACIAFNKSNKRTSKYKTRKGVKTQLNVTVKDRSWKASSLAKIEFGNVYIHVCTDWHGFVKMMIHIRNMLSCLIHWLIASRQDSDHYNT